MLREKLKLGKCQKVKTMFRGELRPYVARGYAGLIGILSQKANAEYEPNPKQKHFRDVQITF